jgi:uncharacterized protein YbjQ (UPF0145 family)
MSDDKKDLTRIEDLSDFIHELNSEEDDAFEGVPDIPTDADSFESPFPEDSSLEESSFESSPFTETSEETSDFLSSEDDSFSIEDSSFASHETSFETEDPFTVSEETELFSEEENELPSNDAFEELATPQYEAPQRTEVSLPETPFKSPESFEDLKKFAEHSTFTESGAEANPSFSLLIKNVHYIEDVHDILTLLKELKIMSDSEEQMKARLMRGTLLIPRISEYAAIFLAHKLRRFDIDIQVGLSDEIHPPKHHEAPETGLVSKHNLYQNQAHSFHFDNPKLELSQIIVAATPSLEGYQVLRYIGVASEHKMLDSHIVENEDAEEIPRHYTELAQKLKAHALKSHANAVVGLNYQLTPIPSGIGFSGHKYRLSCTGNLVWVNKL